MKFKYLLEKVTLFSDIVKIFSANPKSSGAIGVFCVGILIGFYVKFGFRLNI